MMQKSNQGNSSTYTINGILFFDLCLRKLENFNANVISEFRPVSFCHPPNDNKIGFVVYYVRNAIFKRTNMAFLNESD